MQTAVIAGILVLAAGAGAVTYVLMSSTPSEPLAPAEDTNPTPTYQFPPSTSSRGPPPPTSKPPPSVASVQLGSFEPSQAQPSPIVIPPLEVPSRDRPAVNTPPAGTPKPPNEPDDGAASDPTFWDGLVNTVESNLPVPIPGTVKGLLDTYLPLLPDVPNVPQQCAAGVCVPPSGGNPVPGVPPTDSLVQTVLGLLQQHGLPPAVPGAPGIPPQVPPVPGAPGVPEVPGAPAVPPVPEAPGVPQVPTTPGVPSVPALPIPA